MELPGVEGLNTVAVIAAPHARILNGESYRVECCVISEEVIAPVIRSGSHFRLWGDGTGSDPYFAAGRVVQLFPEHWSSGLLPSKVS